jgi:paraquat-inducible protein A
MALSAARAGLLACRNCGLLSGAHARARRCARCGTALHARKPNSIMRTWALILAAYVLFIPANLLPVLETSAFGYGGPQADTIMSGAVHLWLQGAWPLSVVILIASVAVPLAKLLVLTYLLLTVQHRARWNPSRRTRLYRIVDFIGRWSMVDIYVGALLVGLVQFPPLATVSPGPGAIAFGAVVVLTLFASQSFDPRLMWDVSEGRAVQGASHG